MGPPLAHLQSTLGVNILCEPRVLLFQVTRADLNSIQLHIQADGTADWLQRVVLSTLDVRGVSFARTVPRLPDSSSAKNAKAGWNKHSKKGLK